MLYAETPRKQSGSAWFPHPIHPSQQHSSTHLPHLGDATKAAGLKKTNMCAMVKLYGYMVWSSIQKWETTANGLFDDTCESCECEHLVDHPAICGYTISYNPMFDNGTSGYTYPLRDKTLSAMAASEYLHVTNPYLLLNKGIYRSKNTALGRRDIQKHATWMRE